MSLRDCSKQKKTKKSKSFPTDFTAGLLWSVIWKWACNTEVCIYAYTAVYIILHLYLGHLADAVTQSDLQYHFVNETKLLQAKILDSDKSAERSSLTARAHACTYTRTRTLDGDKLAVHSCLNTSRIHLRTHTP